MVGSVSDEDIVGSGDSACVIPFGTETHFTNGFAITIQIRRKFRFVLIQILTKRIGQKFIAISWPGMESQQNDFSTEFELWIKFVSELSLCAARKTINKHVACMNSTHYVSKGNTYLSQTNITVMLHGAISHQITSKSTVYSTACSG